MINKEMISFKIQNSHTFILVYILQRVALFVPPRRSPLFKRSDEKHKMIAKTQLLFALLAAVVTAQSDTTTSSAAAPSSTAGISQCILTCVTSAAAAGGCASL